MDERVEPCSRCKVPAEMPLVWILGNDVSQRVVLCDWCAWVQYIRAESFLRDWGKVEQSYQLEEG